MIVTTRLGSVANITMGQAPEGETYNNEGVGLPLIAGAGDFGPVHPSPKKFTSAPTKICDPGDIVVGIRASIGEKVVADRTYCLGRGVAGLRSKSSLNSRYLWHWLTHMAPVLVAKAKGATFLQVNREDIASLQMELPTLPEQLRIAAILDHADALRAKRGAALAQLDTLTQSIFLDMFGDPVTNDRDWRDDAKLGDVAEIASGVTKGRRLNGKPTRAVPYLAVANVQDRALRLKEVKTIDATEAEIARYRLHDNDLLLTEGGDPDKLGRGSLWTGQIPECIHQNHIFRVRITSPDIDPVFLNWLIGSKRGKRYFLRSAKQTTGIASINMTQLRGFPILMPPVDRQRLFADQVRAVTSLSMLQTVAASELDTLFASLQHRAFRGEL